MSWSDNKGCWSEAYANAKPVMRGPKRRKPGAMLSPRELRDKINGFRKD